MPSLANCSVWPSIRATWLTSACCSGRTSVTPVPSRPGAAGAADAVHVALVSSGGSKLITCVMSSRSSPRAATSVATRVETDAGLEPLQRPLALGLAHVAVHGDGAHVVARELLHQPVGAALRADEDEREAALLLQQAGQRLDLVLGRDRDEAVLHLVDALLDRQLGLEAGGGRSYTRGPARRPRRRAWPRRTSSGACCGSRATILSTCGWKPMSSIRSASSRTRIRTPSSLTALRSMRSCRRPGVATRMSRLARPLRLAGDRDAAVDGGDLQVVGRRDRLELGRDLRGELARRHEDEAARPACVGIEPLDDAARRTRASCPIRSGDFASTSRPASASGRTSVWIRNGLWMSRSASACATRADTPSSWKDCNSIRLLCVVSGRDPTCLDRLQLNREEPKKLNLTGRRNCRPCQHGSSNLGR